MSLASGSTGLPHPKTDRPPLPYVRGRGSLRRHADWACPDPSKNLPYTCWTRSSSLVLPTFLLFCPVVVVWGNRELLMIGGAITAVADQERPVVAVSHQLPKLVVQQSFACFQKPRQPAPVCSFRDTGSWFAIELHCRSHRPKGGHLTGRHGRLRVGFPWQESKTRLQVSIPRALCVPCRHCVGNTYRYDVCIHV